MEAMRKKMMNDPELYGGQAVRKPETISIGSTSSATSVGSSSVASSTASEVPSNRKQTHGRVVVISSDEDSGSDEDVQEVENPHKHRNPIQVIKDALKPVVDHVHPTSQAHPARPIHIPTNRDLPSKPFPDFTQKQPIRPSVPAPNDNQTWETFTEPDDRGLHDPTMNAKDTEKALRDLVEDTMMDENTVIDMSMAKVKGFKEDITLLPHQVLGRAWMATREDPDKKRFGGILADDMGLGKTIQTLTRIVDNRPRKKDQVDGWAASTLVVCPVALVGQWASEIRKMAVGLVIVEHHGASRTTNPADLRRAHVVITSYSILSSEHGSYESSAKDETKGNDKDTDSSDSGEEVFGRKLAPKKAAAKKKKAVKAKDALFRVKWWRIVLDEAHNIKNRTTKAALACCALDGKYRWCLSGTPMQNGVDELYSLIKFLRIKPYNDWLKFSATFSKPIKAGRSTRPIRLLQVVLKAIMLRRKKDLLLNGKPIIDLPKRIVEILPCEFDATERAFYDQLANKIDDALDKLQSSSQTQMNYTSVLVLLLRLRQACNHPSLVSKDYRKDSQALESKPSAPQKEGQDAADDDDELAGLLGGLGMSDRKCQVCQTVVTPRNEASEAPDNLPHCTDCWEIAERARLASRSQDGSRLPPSSAKTRMIMKLLKDTDERDPTDKTIIFSQFTSMLDLIEPFLGHEGIRYVRYDGSMSKDKREASLETIRNDKKIRLILISFKAGSTGLNLTACNNVILVDLWWNPALEDQAFDRAHRFGQTKDVNIYKLTIEDTVEARILQLQETKRELARAALSGDKVKNMKLGMDDLMALFRHGDGRDSDSD